MFFLLKRRASETSFGKKNNPWPYLRQIITFKTSPSDIPRSKNVRRYNLMYGNEGVNNGLDKYSLPLGTRFPMLCFKPRKCCLAGL